VRHPKNLEAVDWWRGRLGHPPANAQKMMQPSLVILIDFVLGTYKSAYYCERPIPHASGDLPYEPDAINLGGSDLTYGAGRSDHTKGGECKPPMEKIGSV
jgi:hypothetical protein